MKDTIVIDLDGTLANVDHRRHLVSGKHRNYEAFHALLGQDPPNDWCVSIMRHFWNMGHEVAIVSARPKSCETATRAWLEKHGVKFNGLYLLRPDGDSTPDQELKRSWLQSYGKDQILFVVDDRQKVVDMWRSEGLTCLQCAAWQEKSNASPDSRSANGR